MNAPINIAILASGAGTNADSICTFFEYREDVRIQLIVTNKPHAGVLTVAERHGVPSRILANDELQDHLLSTLESHKIDFVVLAGFLRPVPKDVVQHFERRIVNIHPALLPQFGGKGMYGRHVHRAVIAAGEKESGITIHYVTEQYDEGGIIFQARCPVEPSDSPESLANRIHHLEYEHYSKVIDQLIKDFK